MADKGNAYLDWPAVGHEPLNGALEKISGTNVACWLVLETGNAKGAVVTSQVVPPGGVEERIPLLSYCEPAKKSNCPNCTKSGQVGGIG